MTSPGSRLLRIVLFSDLHATRLILGLAEVIWGMTLIWPGDTFGRPTYQVMSEVMSEESWAFIFLLSGITQWTILMNGDYHATFPKIFAGWNAVLWIFVCLSMYMSVYPPPAAISGESALAVAATWIFIRTGYKLTGKRIGDHE